jgi:hypothetical protein
MACEQLSQESKQASQPNFCMDYKTYTPSSPLSLFVKCFWTLEAGASMVPEKQRIVPDGCMEMIFNHGDLYYQVLENGKRLLQPRCFVFGQINSPLEIEPSSATEYLLSAFCPMVLLPLQRSHYTTWTIGLCR